MEIGNIVKVEFGVKDPLEKQGQVGKVIEIKETEDSELEVSVVFSDGETGVYFEDCLTIIK